MDSQLTQKTPRRKRVVVVAVISVLTVVAVSIGTVLLLQLFATPKKQLSSTPRQTAEEIMKSLDKTNIASLPSESYKKQINSPSSVGVKLPDRAYTVTVRTTSSTLYSALSATQPDVTTGVQSDFEKLMQEKKLTRTEAPHAEQEGITRTTYADDDVTCQLQDVQPPANSGMVYFHKISCINKSDITAEYDAIEKLLTLYKKAHASINFTDAARTTNTDKNVSYSTIYLSNTTDRSLLLFAAVGDKWEYLADLMQGDAKYSNGQYIITPETKKMISDPKYQGVIEKDIH